MLDLLYLAMIAVVFIACWGLIALCQGLMDE